MKTILSFTFSLLLFSCGNGNTKTTANSADLNKEPVEVSMQDNMAKAYFASGCFWCVEAIYENVNGVYEVISGYSGGHTENPTYEASNTGKTGHAEAVEVIYDPEVVSFETLVKVFYGSQNPIQVNGQGPDNGSQYRSILFYQNAEQQATIEKVSTEVGKNYDKPLAAEIAPFQKFWVGEDYHQNYEKLHPENPYIQNVSIPRYNKFKKKFSELLKPNAH